MKNRLLAFSLVFVAIGVFLLAVFWFAGATRVRARTTDPSGFQNPKSLNTAPTVTAIVPNTTPNDLDTSVVISGTGFVAVLSGTLVMTSPLAYLGDTALEEVSWVNTTTLSATVPWGLVPGVYTLTVINPDGGTGSLSNAFTVTQGIGVWTSGGPYGGDTWHVILNPVVPNQVYASDSESGLFASDDAAGEWRPVRIGASAARPAFDAGDPQVIYLGMGGSLFRSDDGGLTWQSIPRQGQCVDSVRPVAHPTVAGTVYLSVFCNGGLEPGGGLYRSTTWGTNWITMTSGLSDTNVTSLVFDPDDSNVLYLGTHSGEVYISTNGGDSWIFAARLPNHVDGLYVDPFGAHQVWAESNGYSISDPTLPPNLFKSLDPDLTAWSAVTVTSDSHVWSLAFHPTVSGTILAAVDSGYISTDGGQTWQPVGPGLPQPLPWSLGGMKEFAIDPQQPNVIYAATARGIFKSTDGGKSWFDANHKLAGAIPISLAVSPFEPQELYASSNIGVVLKSNNGGQSWQSLDVPWPGWSTNLATDPFLPNRVYFGVDGWGCSAPCIRLSQDGGETFREITYTLPVTYTGWGAYTEIVAPDPHDPGHVLIASHLTVPGGGFGDGLLYASDDYGEHWQQVDFWPPKPVTEIAYDPIHPGTIYAGVGQAGIYKSADWGLTWQVLSSWPVPLYASGLAVHPTTLDLVFALGRDFPEPPALPQGILHSLDGGTTWEHLPTQPSTGPLWALAFVLTDPPSLYTGGLDSGLWRSADDGQTWEVAKGMSVGTIQSLATTTDGERVTVYVGISGGAIGGSDFSAASAGTDLTLLGSGVYRLTTLLLTKRVYLPLVVRGIAP